MIDVMNKKKYTVYLLQSSLANKYIYYTCPRHNVQPRVARHPQNQPENIRKSGTIVCESMEHSCIDVGLWFHVVNVTL